MIRCLIVSLAVAVIGLQAGPVLAQGAFPAPLPAGVAPAKNDSVFPPVNGSVIKNDPAFPPVNAAPRSDSAFPPVNAAPRSDSAFPPVNGTAPRASVGAPSPFPSNGAAPISGGFSPAPAAGGQAGGDAACMDGFVPLRKEAERRGNLIKAASDRRAPPAEACKLIGNFSQSEVKMIKYVESHAQKCGIPAQIHQQLADGHKNTEKLLKQVCGIAQQQAQQPRGPAGPSLSEVLGSSASLPEPSNTKRGGSTFETLNGNVLTR